MENRKSPRFRTRFDTLYGAGAAEGAGILTDISHSGARLEGVSLWPELGLEVRLYVFIQPVAPFELVGRIVRKTESGFAIVFELENPEIRHLVDDVAALVNQVP
ncbi:MAG: PilZ domain-containing protein [Deltaproteobacteria bacterium]|nr:PilZ domain-containing protein [Deltaproteobacteria bacterium]MBW2362741.1 PilZ domain-containing protein [Deltaproteobacteria bacterium]